jgi:catechol 2,3-dioxygenase-like lactoylglutathione lyase family enzyme
MEIIALDHVNIITEDMEETIRFLVNVFDFDVRDAPPPLDPKHYQWLYDSNGRAIFHINSKQAQQAYVRETHAGPMTGAIHHIALKCSGYDAFRGQLERHSVDYRTHEISAANLKQIFFHEPNGVLIELNFFE